MVQRWQLYDPTTSTTWTMSSNPSECSSPPRKKRITEEGTSATNGQVILFEGQDEVQRIEWAGEILDEASYELWTYWFAKRHQVRLTDDLGRVMWVYLESFTPKRVRSALMPWRHSYTAEAIILSIVED